jgi:hypothetical protein
MTEEQRYRLYDHDNVDPLWDQMAPGGQPAMAELLGAIDIPVVHREMLRAALPGLQVLVDVKGKGTQRLETARLRQRLHFWERIGLVARSGDALLRILDPAALRDFALKHDLYMPLDGLRRAHAWASQGHTMLHYQEAEALEVLIQMREEKETA